MHRRFALGMIFVLAVSVPAALSQSKKTAGAPKTGTAAAKPLATQELDVEGVVAEVIESRRKGDTLTVRVRLRNTGTATAKVNLAPGGQSYHTANYIVAGNTRYDILRDTEGHVIATPRDGGGWLEAKIPPKSTFAWWAKYEAPPASEKSYTLYLHVGPPIEDVPIIDKEPSQPQ